MFDVGDHSRMVIVLEMEIFKGNVTVIWRITLPGTVTILRMVTFRGMMAVLGMACPKNGECSSDGEGCQLYPVV